MYISNEIIINIFILYYIFFTCIVDKNVQSGFSLEEGFSKALHRLQTWQIQMHEQHLIIATFLENNHKYFYVPVNCQEMTEAVTQHLTICLC